MGVSRTSIGIGVVEKDMLSLKKIEPSKLKLKNKIAEEEYEEYLDFGIEIGQLVLNTLSDVCTPRDIEIFKAVMNFTDDQNLDSIEEYGFREAEIDLLLKRMSEKLFSARYLFVNKFNLISDENILNYLVVGISNIYNIKFLEFVLNILDKTLSQQILKRIYQIQKNIDRQNYCKLSEDEIYGLITFPANKNCNADLIYDSLIQLRRTYDENNNGTIYLEHLDTAVEFESFLERKMLLKFDECSFVKKLKTQSIKIEYLYKNKKYNYYPDFQILTKDNELVIVEIKGVYGMCDSLSIAKYKALKSYCEKNGYGYLIIDDKGNTLEEISKIEVKSIKEAAFLKFLKYRKRIKYIDFKSFKKLYKLKMKEMVKIVLDNETIEFHTKTPFYIKYNQISDIKS